MGRRYESCLYGRAACPARVARRSRPSRGTESRTMARSVGGADSENLGDAGSEEEAAGRGGEVWRDGIRTLECALCHVPSRHADDSSRENKRIQ